ncbi:MAG: FAD-dependent thymidylate synthase [archaeon]
MQQFSETEKQILKKHVSNLDNNVYLIFNLPPEVRAVLFAYVSRSPLSFRENLLKLLKGKELNVSNLVEKYSGEELDFSKANESAKAFHEKWVVGYGHSSIAEHAVASIAFEDVSIIASKVIEDNRLASYTEKSTRYQVFDKNRYYKPKKIMDSKFSGGYEKTCNNLFDLYWELTPKMMDFIKEKYPIEAGMNEKLYESVSKARACDNLRYLLPSSTLTNLAMTANARVLEHAIRKMLSNPLDEMQELGFKLKQEVTKVIPVLVKFADYNPYIANTEKKMYAICEPYSAEKPVKGNANEKEENTAEKDVTLVDYDKEAENKLIVAILYRFTHKNFESLLDKAKKMGEKEKLKIIDEFLNEKSQFDSPLRELEHLNYAFDVLVDYGAFRDIQRHRMCTQTNQLVTTKNGYSLPEELIEAGFKKEFENAMLEAKETFEKIAEEMPYEAQYVVPLAYKKRVLMTWNLRELHHFIRLRSRKEGHISYRKIAWHMYDELIKVHPFIAKYIACDKSEGPSRG